MWFRCLLGLLLIRDRNQIVDVCFQTAHIFDEFLLILSRVVRWLWWDESSRCGGSWSGDGAGCGRILTHCFCWICGRRSRSFGFGLGR